MKKALLLPILLLIGFSANAQVGINTEDPKSTLDVRSSSRSDIPDGIIAPRITGDQLLAKESIYTSAQNGAIVYVTSPRTSNTGAIKTLNITSSGLYIYNANAVNSSALLGLWEKFGISLPPTNNEAFAAKINGSLSLLNLGIDLLGSNIQTIPLPTTLLPNVSLDISSPQITTTGTDSYYTIPSSGIYQINYSYRTGQGLSLELLGANRPGLIITKTALGAASSTATAIDYRFFGGVQLLNLLGISVANISLTQGQISHIYQFNTGDRVRFGVITGGLALGILTDASAEMSILKIK